MQRISEKKLHVAPVTPNERGFILTHVWMYRYLVKTCADPIWIEGQS